MITIVDYGAGNIRSVANAFESLGMKTSVADNGKAILQAERIVLPGVGAFGAAMRELDARALIEPLKRKIREGIPFLGICLGMQLLFTSSEESPGVCGLNIIDGSCVRLTTERVPNIGWCSTVDVRTGTIAMYYYVHSYAVVPSNSAVVTMIENTQGFCAGIHRDTVAGVQFHPEKSGDAGIGFLRQWGAL